MSGENQSVRVAAVATRDSNTQAPALYFPRYPAINHPLYLKNSPSFRMDKSPAPSQDSSSTIQGSAALQSSAEDDKMTSSESLTPSAPLPLTTEEAVRLDEVNPAPSTTNVSAADFPVPSKEGYHMHRPLNLKKCFEEVIEWLPPTEANRPLPPGFNEFREQSMLDYYPHVTKWVRRGKPLLSWNEHNRDKMRDLLKTEKRKTHSTFGSYAYVPGSHQKGFRELALSVLEYFSYFRGGRCRIAAASAKTVKYYLTGGSDWGDRGRKAGSAFKASCRLPKEDYLLHEKVYWTAAPPENEDENPTRVLKWGPYPSTIVGDGEEPVKCIKWGWNELEPEDEELGATILQYWNGPMHFETKDKDTDTAKSGEKNAASATETVNRDRLTFLRWSTQNDSLSPIDIAHVLAWLQVTRLAQTSWTSSPCK